MSEQAMEMECGFYDELHQMLHDGEIDIDGIEELYAESLITKEQYSFAKDYLKK